MDDFVGQIVLDYWLLLVQTTFDKLARERISNLTIDQEFLLACIHQTNIYIAISYAELQDKKRDVEPQVRDQVLWP